MQHIQPEDMESQAAATLDTWITARLAGREELAALPNLAPQAIGLIALAHDLLSLAEDIQPDDEFVLHLGVGLKAISLRRLMTQYRLSSFTGLTSLEPEEVENKLTDS